MKNINVPYEKDIQKAIMQYLDMKGVIYWRSNTGAAKFKGKTKDYFVRFGEAGISDIIGIYPCSGRLMAIEVKRSKKHKLTVEQYNFLKNIKENNGVTFVVSDAGEFEDYFSCWDDADMERNLEQYAPNNLKPR